MSIEPAALAEAVREAIRSIDLTARVEAALRSRPRPPRPPVLLAMGKSAAPMLTGALRAYGDGGFARAIAAVPTGAASLGEGARCEGFVCGHPLPDDQSVAAARAMLDAVQGLSADDTVVVLLSGGASAAVCLPRDGATLDEVRAACEALLSSGLAIEALNAARGRFDAFKQGGLARAARPAKVLTLASADILGGDDDVWPTLGGAPTFIPGEAVDGAVLARPSDLRDAVAERLSARGLAVRVRPEAVSSVESLAEAYAVSLSSLPSRGAWVAVGEPTVALPRARGRGGRAGRLALGVARSLAGTRGWSFVACGSDGVDGSSGCAGAVVTGETWGARDCERAWEAYDDGPYLRAAGASVVTGPTGINLLDVHAMVRA